MQVLEARQHHTEGEYKVVQSSKYEGEDWWQWSVWIEAKANELDKIDNVIYNLHFTFNDPVRIIKTRKNKFKLDSSGWGTFIIYVRINFKDETVLDIEHELVLHYPDGTATEA
jgi:transcription initiation factor IIF auxiliary subunit